MPRRKLYLFLPFIVSVILCLLALGPPPPPPPPCQKPTTSLKKDRFSGLLKVLLKSQKRFNKSTLTGIRPFLRIRNKQGREDIRLLLEHEGSPEPLRALGFQVTSRIKSFYTGWMAKDKIHLLQQLKSIRTASFSQRLHPHLNVSTPMIHIPQTRLQHKVDGRGVLIGVIDTGIDYRHPAFRNEDGTTRIKAIVDYSLPATPGEKNPPKLFYEHEINKALKDDTVLGHEDEVGHGTHVAGIALGNNRAPFNKLSRYQGVAPRAELIMVKGLRKNSGDFDSGDVLDGIIFVHNLAKKLKKPYVLNLSLGGHRGGHNGSSLLERAIDVFSGKGKPGRSVVVSAGNEGIVPIHASGWLRPPDKAKIQIQIPIDSKITKEDESVLLECWFPEKAQPSLYLISPGGLRFGPFGIKKETDTPTRTTEGVVSVHYNRQNFKGISHQLTIVLSNDPKASPSIPLERGNWTIEISGDVPRYDLWLVDATSSTLGRVELAGPLTQEMLIGVPGAANGAITVGSFNSRSGWANQLGSTSQFPVKTGDISDFSSPGPTLDGRPKPEIVAPGIFIASPASAFANSSEASLMHDGPYLVSQGTSQAAPHVAGTIALLLQKRPDLDTPGIRQLLLQNATTDQFTKEGAVYHRKWGFGKLHALNVLRSLEKPSDQALSTTFSAVGSLHTEIPADGTSFTMVYVIPKDAKGQNLEKGQKVQLQTNAGKLSELKELHPGFFQAKLLSSSEPAQAQIRAIVNGKRLETTLTVDFVASNHNQPRQGCQCQIQPTPHDRLPTAVFLFLFFPLLYHLRKAR